MHSIGLRFVGFGEDGVDHLTAPDSENGQECVAELSLKLSNNHNGVVDKAYSMAMLTAPLKPDTAIVCDSVPPVLDSVVSSNIVLAGFKDVLCCLQNLLMGIALIASGNYD